MATQWKYWTNFHIDSLTRTSRWLGQSYLLLDNYNQFWLFLFYGLHELIGIVVPWLEFAWKSAGFISSLIAESSVLFLAWPTLYQYSYPIPWNIDLFALFGQIKYHPAFIVQLNKTLYCILYGVTEWCNKACTNSLKWFSFRDLFVSIKLLERQNRNIEWLLDMFRESGGLRHIEVFTLLWRNLFCFMDYLRLFYWFWLFFIALLRLGEKLLRKSFRDLLSFHWTVSDVIRNSLGQR